MRARSITGYQFCLFALVTQQFAGINTQERASQLYEDLLASYNKIALPVVKAGDNLTVEFGASMIRIIDIDEKAQVFTTNLWLEMRWTDSKLRWKPKDYDGIKKMHIPTDKIWTPDIVLYNNAAGDPDVSIFTDALVFHDGKVVWQPPAIYKSFCAIDVLYFPYDEQKCEMKFGLWSYTGTYVDMRQLPKEDVLNRLDKDNVNTEYLSRGMDLSYYEESDEWDLLDLHSRRYEVVYGTCCGSEVYVDIRYYFHLRRKPLFYTTNLIVPCILIAFLVTFVFYLPSHSMKKLTFSISILVTITVFFLVLIDLIPPTSIVIPLFGKYLLFTLILLSISICVSVIIVNLHFRRASTHKMSKWTQKVFLHVLPRLLMMERPQPAPDVTIVSQRATREMELKLEHRDLPPPISYDHRQHSPYMLRRNETPVQRQFRLYTQLVLHVVRNVQFISDYFKRLEEEEELANDWKFVAMVVDRLFLIIFTLTNVVGTFAIILTAPAFYDTTLPLVKPSATKPLGGDTLGPLYLDDG